MHKLNEGIGLLQEVPNLGRRWDQHKVVRLAP